MNAQNESGNVLNQSSEEQYIYLNAKEAKMLWTNDAYRESLMVLVSKKINKIISIGKSKYMFDELARQMPNVDNHPIAS